MENGTIIDLETMCRSISNEGSEVFNWVWDHRFDAVMATINERKAEEAQAILDKRLFGFWDRRKIHMAPHEIRRIAELIGGIDEGQILFSSDPELDSVIICVWWPWNSGGCISIRIGFVPLKPSVGQAELDASLQGWFGV